MHKKTNLTQKLFFLFSLISLVIATLFLLPSLALAQSGSPAPSPAPSPTASPTSSPASPSTSSSSGLNQLQLQIPIGERQSLTISGSTIAEYIEAVIIFASAAIVALAIVMVIVGGIQWIIAAGAPNKISNAKDTIVKAFLGLFLALFSVFILQTLNPALVRFEPLDVAGIEGVNCCDIDGKYSSLTPGECSAQGGTSVDYFKCIENKITSDQLCADEATVKCNEEYTNTTTNATCIGKKCDPAASGNPQICRDDGTGTFACKECKPLNAECTDHNECCENVCQHVGDKDICVSVDGSGDGLFDACSITPGDFGCKPGLVCSDGYSPDLCVYGYTGNKCNDDTDCAVGYVCINDGINHCEPKAYFSRCDTNNDCPSGTRCRNPKECKANHVYWKDTTESDLSKLWKRVADEAPPTGFSGLKYSSATDGTGDIECEDWCSDLSACGAISWSLCLPDDVPCLCTCRNSQHCRDSDVPNASTANYCFDGTGADNYCHTGEEGTKCTSFDPDISSRDPDRSCKSGLYCNTKNANVCTPGTLGVSCDNDEQCDDAHKCCAPHWAATWGVCWPKNVDCPDR